MNNGRKLSLNRKISFAATMVGIALSCVNWGALNAQTAADSAGPVGRVYVAHNRPSGGCPSMDWHVVLGENNTISGTVGADDMKALFRVTGNYSAAKLTFRMYGNEVGGTRTAAVNGTILPDGLKATIEGLPVKAPCQGKLVNIRRIDQALINGD